jgi:hypothetical protein
VFHPTLQLAGSDRAAIHAITGLSRDIRPADVVVDSLAVISHGPRYKPSSVRFDLWRLSRERDMAA